MENVEPHRGAEGAPDIEESGLHARSGEAAHGDLESPEPERIHPRREAVGV